MPQKVPCVSVIGIALILDPHQFARPYVGKQRIASHAQQRAQYATSCFLHCRGPAHARTT